MKNRRVKKYYFLVIVCGMVNGIIAYYSARRQLADSLSPNMDFDFGWLDFMNIIFITDDFDKYAYMDRRSVLLLLIPFAFYVIGILIGSRQYIERGVSYYGMLAVRSKNTKDLVNHIHGTNIAPSALYSFSYILGIWSIIFVNGHTMLWNAEGILWIMGRMICLGISRVFILAAILEIIFMIMLKKGISVALFFGILALTLFYLVDISFEGVNLVLYHDRNYFLDSILIMLVVYVCCRWFGKQFKICIN